MNRFIATAVALAALAAPATASAAPTQADKTNAAKECKAERGNTDATREAFNLKHKNLGACVSKTAKEEAAERRAANTNAVKTCKAQRDADAAGFKAQHRNFGACVSKTAKALKAAADQQDAAKAAARKSAAKTCDAERGETEADVAAFEAKHGTNANKSNAFGKCVSKHEAAAVSA